MQVSATIQEVRSIRAKFLKVTSMNGVHFRNSPNYQQRISDRVHDFVVKKIFEGYWPQGESITVDEIREELNTSNGPVREALMRLHQERWIDRLPHRGMTVGDFSDKTKLKELTILRMSLELGPTCILAESATSQQIAELEKILQDIEEIVSNGDRELHVLADIRFHQAVVHWGGGNRIGEQFDSVLLQTLMVRDSARPMEMSEDNHRDLFNAIISHDVGKAVKVLQKHVIKPAKRLGIM